MSAWAAPGVRCVCVDDNWPSPLPIPTRVPMLHEVLTVAAIVLRDNRIFLTFEEIPVLQACDGFSGQVSFTVESFKPLISRSQADDVALFAPLLDTKPVEAA